MSEPTTPQAALWKGQFGDAYIDRNPAAPDVLDALTRFWEQVLSGTAARPATSILEVGANVGRNLRAIARISNAELYGLEPNAKARAVLEGDQVVAPGRALDGLASRIPLADRSIDLVFTSGVLIHIHPRDLLASCREIHRVSGRYIACAEYFSDREQEVAYRGASEALFKRDFGGFWLDNFPDLKLVDYGFAWKRATGLDNLTWQLFEKA